MECIDIMWFLFIQTVQGDVYGGSRLGHTQTHFSLLIEGSLFVLKRKEKYI